MINEPNGLASPEQLVEPATCPRTGFWRLFALGCTPRNSFVPGAQRGGLDRGAFRDADVYVSQNVFSRHFGTVDAVKLICGAWIDLDIHNMPALANRSVADRLEAVLEHCDAVGLPRPSYMGTRPHPR